MIHETRVAGYFAGLAVCLSGLAVLLQGDNADAAKKTPPDLQVEAVIYNYLNPWAHYQEGSFASTGTIEDEGPAAGESLDDVYFLTLSGEGGDVDVLIDVKHTTVKRTKYGGNTCTYRGSFEVVGGTGAYAHLQASGSATGASETNIKLGPDSVWDILITRRWHLEGSVNY
jgi:hypothetical protein